MKSYIIILSVDCNTHLHTLIEKTKKFLNVIIFGENKGGAPGHQVGGNALFGADRNFWPMGWPGGGGPKI